MLRIRLSRHGAKKDPHYRVVVTDKRNPRDGRFVEILGFYNPALKPVRLHLELERIDHWIGNGAQPSETVRALIKRVRNGQANQDPPASEGGTETPQTPTKTDESAAAEPEQEAKVESTENDVETETKAKDDQAAPAAETATSS